MFNNLRKKTKSFTTKIFLLLIAASFALWGVGDIFSNKRDPVIAKIGSETITAGEFIRTYQRILSDLRRNSNGQITDEIALSYDLHNQTLRQMINEKIVDIEVDKIGISVSKKRLRNSIFASPYFKDQLGQFSQEQFEYNLRQLGLDEKEFLKELSKTIKRDQINNIFSFEKKVPSLISEIYYKIRNEERDIKTITFSSNNYKINKNITSSEIKDFYEKNSDRYIYPENRSFSVISIKPADIINDIKLTEKEIREEFESYPEKYNQPEQREIFLINTDSEQEAINLINKISDSSKFLEEASTFLNKERDSLNLGFLTFSDLPKELAEKSFKAKLGKIQGPEKTPFGWRIYLVNTIRKGTKLKFSEVKSDISKELKTAIAIDKLYDLGNAFYDDIASGSTALEAAESINATIKTFDKVKINGTNYLGKIVEDLPPYPELLEVVYSTKLDDTSNLTNTISNIMFAVHINEVNLSRAMSIDEAENQIIIDIKNFKSVKEAQKDASYFLENIKKGESFEALAKNNNLVIMKLNNVKLDGSGAEGVLNVNALTEVFKLELNQISPIIRYDEKSFTISKLVNIKSTQSIDSEKIKFINEDLSKNIANDHRKIFIKQLSAQHTIKIEKNIFNSLFE
ncbi:MAG: Peptidyl-prolyl cis-trans isomerase D [Alphaproteobacteria bacterium MarineAlpha9_Bin1]|nr:MAG: Peptidyl-prolyl cis-trans isomerase D [Alphaproteobacteria bacterium MarineAlpha9_Bin1]